MWWEQQVAVDDARVDQADDLKGVQVGALFQMWWPDRSSS
jgi:hypothetical protein